MALAAQGAEHHDTFAFKSNRERKTLHHSHVVSRAVRVGPIPVHHQGGQSALHDCFVGRIEAASRAASEASVDLPTMARFIMRFPLVMASTVMAVGKRAVSARAEFAEAKEHGYYSIGKAAELSGVTAKMIRHYESLQLIPKAERTAGDYRVYTPADIHTLRFIRRARTLGFSIEEISTLLNLWRNQRRTSEQVKRLALKHIAELDTKIAELQSMRAALADLAKSCHGDSRPDCPILDDLSRVPRSQDIGVDHE